MRVQCKVPPLLTAPGGRTGAVAKCAGSGPVRLRKNATISRVSSSVSVLPNCTRAITCTASSNVATDPSWKYGGVIEDVEIGGVFGQPETALVNLLASGRLAVRFHDPDLLEQLAADPDPIVAGHAPSAHESLEI